MSVSFASTWINAVLEAVRLSWQIQLGLLITAVVVVVFPKEWSGELGLNGLIAAIRPYCFVLSLLMCVLLVINIVELVYRHTKMNRGYQWVLKNLSDEERSVLRRYIEGNTKTQSFNIASGVAAGLEGTGVLYRASNAGHSGSLAFDFNIQPWAWTRLKKNPKLLDPPPTSVGE
jgi:ABC-type multidrug transport system fused ATPase/permease subunit